MLDAIKSTALGMPAWCWLPLGLAYLTLWDLLRWRRPFRGASTISDQHAPIWWVVEATTCLVVALACIVAAPLLVDATTGQLIFAYLWLVPVGYGGLLAMNAVQAGVRGALPRRLPTHGNRDDALPTNGRGTR